MAKRSALADTVQTKRRGQGSSDALKGATESVTGSVRFNVNIPRDLHYQFKMKALENHETMGDVVRAFIIEYISR